MKLYVKQFFSALTLLLFFFPYCRDAKETQKSLDPQLLEKAKQIHEQAIVIDTHCDTPMAIMNRGLDLGTRQEKTEVDFIRMKEGGLDASFFAVFVANQEDDKQPSKKALEMIDEIYNQVERHPDKAALAFSPSDIRKLEQSGLRAILIGLENGGPIEASLPLLRTYYRLGVRYITLTHSGHNLICDAATDENKPKWNGLSPFGEKVVAEMNRLGMLIDVSHISDEAFWDVIKVSRAPVFASHSCARAICNAPRNLSDEMIKALAEKGGVVQINFYSAFLDQGYKDKSDAAWKKIEPQLEKLREIHRDNRQKYWDAVTELWQQQGIQNPTSDIVLDHIDHIVRLVGVDYVGLGSDFDGAGSFPQGLENVSKFPLITYHLLKRGYREEDIKKILGGNFLRVFEQAIAVAEAAKK